MKIDPHGACSQPSLAVIGGWDPLLPAHAALFGQMREYASGNGLSTLVILLDPNPAAFVRGALNWPVYDDLAWRIRYILQAGVDGVAVVGCDEAILGHGIKELLDCVQPATEIRELWIGAQQTLGRGSGGNLAAILGEAQLRAIGVRTLPASADSYAGSHARRFLQAGSVVQAMQLVRRPPTWNRPADGQLCNAWPAGRYRARAIAHAGDARVAPARTVEFASGPHGLCVMRWPEDSEGLQFVAGPADPPD